MRKMILVIALLLPLAARAQYTGLTGMNIPEGLSVEPYPFGHTFMDPYPRNFYKGVYSYGIALSPTQLARINAAGTTTQTLCNAGPCVFLSTSASRGNAEFCNNIAANDYDPSTCEPNSFINQFLSLSNTNPNLKVTSCGWGGQPASVWEDNTATNGAAELLYRE